MLRNLGVGIVEIKEIFSHFRSKDFYNGRIPSEKGEKEGEEQAEKKNYKQRYLVFLQSLHHANKSKKEIEEAQSKKKEERMRKLREEMGYTNIDSKLKSMKSVKEKSEEDEVNL